ncbi:MAG: alpha/beta hydrolase [Anaerolineales bacterium]
MNRVPAGVEVERVVIGHIPAAWIKPDGAQSEKVIVHLHGGGYVLGGIESSLAMCILMAQTLKRKVLLPEYRLAPEHPFPAAVEDAAQVYLWLLAQGYPSRNIVISGDSAGGGLSLAAAMSLREAGAPLPAAVVCMSPWTDLTFSGKSHVTKARVEPVLREDVLRMWAAAYCGEENFSHPLISPLYGDFRGFPPLLIQVGGDEILLDDSIALAEKARADGADVTLKIWAGMWHVWQALGEALPESKRAFEEMAAFLADSKVS